MPENSSFCSLSLSLKTNKLKHINIQEKKDQQQKPLAINPSNTNDEHRFLSDMPFLKHTRKSGPPLGFLHRILGRLSKGEEFLAARFRHRRGRRGLRKGAGRGCRCSALVALGFLPLGHLVQMLTHLGLETIVGSRFRPPECKRRVVFAGRERIHRRKNLIDNGMEIFVATQKEIRVHCGYRSMMSSAYDVDRTCESFCRTTSPRGLMVKIRVTGMPTAMYAY